MYINICTSDRYMISIKLIYIMHYKYDIIEYHLESQAKKDLKIFPFPK